MPDIPGMAISAQNAGASPGNGTLTTGGPFVLTFMMPSGAVFLQVSIPLADWLTIATLAAGASATLPAANYAENAQVGLSNQVFNKQ